MSWIDHVWTWLVRRRFWLRETAKREWRGLLIGIVIGCLLFYGANWLIKGSIHGDKFDLRHIRIGEEDVIADEDLSLEFTHLLWRNLGEKDSTWVFPFFEINSKAKNENYWSKSDYHTLEVNEPIRITGRHYHYTLLYKGCDFEGGDTLAKIEIFQKAISPETKATP